MKQKKELNEKNARALEQEELENVNGGMKLEFSKSPKTIKPILNFIFRTKKEQN